jgi:Ca2+:H+ antiporter
MPQPNGSANPNESTPLLPREGPERSGVTRNWRTWKKIPRHSVRLSYLALTQNYVNWALVFVPLGILSGKLGWPPVATFVLNFIAIVPLASLLSFATEELAAKLGDTLGGLLNATFGNAVELIVRFPLSCLTSIGVQGARGTRVPIVSSF